VIEPAVVPTEPIRDTMLYALLGSFAGFVFSVGLAFLIELLQDLLRPAMMSGKNWPCLPCAPSRACAARARGQTGHADSSRLSGL